MKIAILSDLHGNLTSLKCILKHVQSWQPELLISNGDLLSQGPSSAACYRLLKEFDKKIKVIFIKGNHDEYVVDAARGDISTLPKPQQELFKMSYFSAAQFTTAEINAIDNWPVYYELTHNNQHLYITHASMNSNIENMAYDLDEIQLLDKIHKSSDVFITSHSHHYYQRIVKGRLIVNTGSAGRPLSNRGYSCEYIQLEVGQKNTAELIRMDYSVKELQEELLNSGIDDKTYPYFMLIKEELQTGEPQFPNFRRFIMDEVLAERVSAYDAVMKFLKNKNAN